MAKEPENPVLEHLRAIRGDTGHLREAVDRIELRLASVEGHIASFQLSDARQNSELDKLRQRLARIEKRLELVDGD
jgi:predicted  nucleic acid-binding Zn-ribbon protein